MRHLRSNRSFEVGSVADRLPLVKNRLEEVELNLYSNLSLTLIVQCCESVRACVSSK